MSEPSGTGLDADDEPSPNDPPALRALPWRIVHDLDDERYPVSRAAARFLDSVWDLPLIALSAVAPRTLVVHPQFRELGVSRARLVDLRERIVRAAARLANEDKLVADAGLAAAAGGLMPSEALSPAAANAAHSPAASVALVNVDTILTRALSKKLAFVAEVPELLPLSLIVPLASRNSALLARLRERMVVAEERLCEFAERVEAGDKLGFSKAEMLVHFPESDADAAAPRRTPTSNQQRKRGGTGRDARGW
jgi:hypothetical protein